MADRSLAKAGAQALVPFLLHGLARVADDALGTMLHTSLDLPALPWHALALVRPGHALSVVLAWGAAGVACGALGWLRDRRSDAAGDPAPMAAVGEFWPLLLRPLITLLALVSLALQPTYPYGFTLPVALTQDWGIAQDVLAGAALLALWVRFPVHAVRLPRRFGAVLGMAAFVAYAVLTPAWARVWAGHPGNEPKTLRMAVALGHWLSLDVAPVSAPMEELPADAIGALPRALARVAHETAGLATALARGPHAVGASAITATRITRQTIQGKDGGVYHVLAPGPSLLLAPALRVDRFLDLRAGTPGRLLASLLLVNALAAALVSATFLLVRDATGRPILSAAVAAAFALLPPSLFYFFQFYPEMLGALVLAVALRALLFVPWWTPRRALALGLLLATLPWLHQKFLPVWGVLTLAALGVLVAQMARLSSVLRLLLPQLFTFAAFALYNFAITGSARPDALFLAWGPRGITTARLGQGLLGLVLDARFGIVPGVPLLLLAGAGLLAPGRGAARLRWALPVVLAYYATVAAADNWSGAVCNLGRYVMPVMPWAIALVAVALGRIGTRRGALAVGLALLGWSAVLGHALWMDPHAANDSAVLHARSVFADPNLYLPNLFVRSWSEALPGTGARVLAWAALALALAVGFHRAARVPRAVACVLLAGFGLGLLLELGDGPRRTPAFGGAVPAGRGMTVFVSGAAEAAPEQVVLEGGRVHLLVRAPEARATLRIAVHGPGGVVAWPGHAPVAIPESGLVADVPLGLLGQWTGRRGAREALLQADLDVATAKPLALIFPVE